MTEFHKGDLVIAPPTGDFQREYAIFSGEKMRTKLHPGHDWLWRVDYASGEFNWFVADDLTLVSRLGQAARNVDQRAGGSLATQPPRRQRRGKEGDT